MADLKEVKIDGTNFIDAERNISNLGTVNCDINLATDKNIKVNSLNPKKTIVLTAGGGIPRGTNGCVSFSKVELSSNKNMIGYLEFTAGTTKYAQWNLTMPDNYDGGTVTARFYWTCGSGTTGASVTWGIQGVAYSDDSALDAAFGTAQTVADTLITLNDLHISSETSTPMTITNAGAGRFTIIQVYATAGNLTPRLLSVKLKYGIDSYSD